MLMIRGYRSQLERFTAESFNRDKSCNLDESNNIGIFLQESPAAQGIFLDGFEVSIYYEPKCLVEGDMFRGGGEVCAEMIRDRCGQMGIDP